MSENINFTKPVFNKNAYEKVIDTSFKQLGTPSIQQQLAIQPTVDEFFAMYNEGWRPCRDICKPTASWLGSCF